MIYGPGCTRGNFPLLVKMAKRLPFFPDVDNRRSMIYVKNLAELVAQVIAHGDAGLFLPQNAEHVRTSDLAKAVADEAGKNIQLIKVFNPALKGFLSGATVVKKAFGDLYYELDPHRGPGLSYCVYDLVGSVHNIAVEEGWSR